MPELSIYENSPDSGIHLIRYEAMCLAIAECHRVDEAKDIREKARALEAYYQQARNTEAERKALDIRLRAERRAGQLLAELGKMTKEEAASMGGSAKATISSERMWQKSEYAETLATLKMTPIREHVGCDNPVRPVWATIQTRSRRCLASTAQAGITNVHQA